MDTPRQYPRISVVDGCMSASMRVKDKYLAGIRVTSLSLGGVFIFINTSHTPGVVVGRRIEDLILHHPDLPSTPMSGTVMRTLGGGEGMEVMGCGLRFDPLPEAQSRILGTYIESYLQDHEEPFVP